MFVIKIPADEFMKDHKFFYRPNLRSKVDWVYGKFRHGVINLKCCTKCFSAWLVELRLSSRFQISGSYLLNTSQFLLTHSISIPNNTNFFEGRPSHGAQLELLKPSEIFNISAGCLLIINNIVRSRSSDFSIKPVERCLYVSTARSMKCRKSQTETIDCLIV